MNKNHFKEYICRPYCGYFKEGQKEDMACRGAQIIELLIDRKRIDVMNIPPLTKSSGLWNKYKRYLSSHVCNQCSFQADDCDFQSPEYQDDMEPCGGFILLAHLNENGLIEESDLEP